MRRALDSKELFPRLFGRSWSLAESIAVKPGEEVPEYKWIHVASEGMYRGHWQGEFELTRAVFESFVANLHQHPQFTTGTLRLGAESVTAGVKPTIQFDYEHASEMPATEGMIPSMGAPAPAWVCDCEVRDADDGTAQLFALAKLGSQIRGQISRNEYRFVSIAFNMESDHWESGEPQGPVLTSIAFTNHPFLKNLESYAAANRRPGQGPEDRIQPRASGIEAPADTTPKGSSMNASATADFEKFRNRICVALAVRTTLADEAVIDAATEAASTGGGLKGMLEALGVKDAGSALKVIPELMAARGKLAETMAELDQLLQGQVAQDAAMADGDVAAVMSAKGWKEELKRPLLAERSSRMNEAVVKLGAKATHVEKTNARAAARVEFLKEYGVTAPAGIDTRHLSTTIAATKGGTQLEVNTRALPLADREEGNATGGETVDLRKLTGNPTERVIKHLDSKDPSFKTLPHYQRVKRATEFAQTNEILV